MSGFTHYSAIVSGLVGLCSAGRPKKTRVRAPFGEARPTLDVLIVQGGALMILCMHTYFYIENFNVYIYTFVY